jgi:hypothetical protein
MLNNELTENNSLDGTPNVSESSGSNQAVSSTMGQQGTTTFVSDGSVLRSTRNMVTSMLAPLYKSVSQDGSQDIIDFLKKPVRARTGNFLTSDSGIFQTLYLPSDIFANSLNPAIYNKILGVQLMRADIVLTLTVNAVRFQQGRYILAFCPSGGAPVNQPPFQAFFRAHAANLMHITQLPHVEIDLSTQTSVQLVIPYSSGKTHYQLSTTTVYASAGESFLYAYSALVAGSGPTSVPYNLWVNFDNVELTGATVVQSNFSVTSKEQRSGGVGPISGVFTKVAEVSSILSEVPLLSSVASPLSWASEILARSAKALGFSKPIVLNLPSRVTRSGLPYGASSDGASTAHPLGLVSTNEVMVFSGAGATQIDEMSIDFIKQQFAWAQTVTWSSSNSTGDLLTTLGANPILYSAVLPQGVSTTPVQFLASSFRYWRGGLKFRFKIVKTEFHSGRLVVSFAPYAEQEVGGITPTLDQTIYLHREVIDLRLSSEFEICIPYVSSDLYQYTYYGYNPGNLFVHVLDPLIAPSSVSNSVTILIEVAGAPDLEFAVPMGQDYDVFCPATTQSGYSLFKCADMGSDSSSILPSSVAVGEKVQSIRQLLKRLQYSISVNGIPNATAGTSLQIFPFTLNPAMQFNTNTSNIYRGAYHTDMFTKFSMCYALSSGGVRIVAYPLKPTVTNPISHVFMDVLPTLTTPNDTSQYVTNNVPNNPTFTPINTNVDGFINVQIPSYNRMVARPTCVQLVNVYDGTYWNTQPSLVQGANWLQLTIQAQDYSSTSTDSYQWYRSAADDFNLSMWCGTVPILATTVHIP